MIKILQCNEETAVVIILKYDTVDESEKSPEANSWENNYHFH